MKYLRRLAAVFLSLCLLCSLSGNGALLPVHAAEESPLSLEVTYVNPLYEDIISEHDLTKAVSRNAVTYAEPEYVTSPEEAGMVLREYMKNREETAIVYYHETGYDEAAFRVTMAEIAESALVHTGEPTEGDYLMWQYAGWSASASGSVSGNDYYWTITYTYTYYTTAEEEAQVDAAVEDVLQELNVSGASDYKKVSAIYDYICDNVVYDYDHLNDSSYKHQFTAYAALIDGTCVCQGYAVLFYRLALELGVDARLIPGTGNGEAHGWNIVELNHLYYNLDSTWDAGMTSYNYFLRCEANFDGHYRDPEYDTQSFHAEYPMDDEDYVPNQTDSCTHSYTSSVTTAATCTTNGVRTYTCSACGHSYTETISAAGHSYSASVTSPTCTEDGENVYTCSRCGDSYSETIAATGHSWDEGVVQKAPTDTEEGIYLYTCETCGGTRTETISASSTVYRIYGNNRYETAFKAADTLKEILGIEKFDNIIVASGDDFPDALSGSYLASKTSAPILLVNKDTVEDVKSYIEANLTEGGTVYLLGGVNAVPKAMEEGLGDYQVVRFAGKNRFETNLLILEEAGVTDEDILVCNAWGYADSLSASALSRPILLVDSTLTSEQESFLNALSADNKIYIIGGTAAVIDAMMNTLSAYGEVERIGGSNRYETSVNVAKKFFTDPDHLILTYAYNFPDGLSGGPLAISRNAPLILTATSDRSYAVSYAKSIGVSSGIVLGGNGLISDSAVREIFVMEDSDAIIVE